MFEVTDRGIERSIPTLDEFPLVYELLIPKEVFIEAYEKYILLNENDDNK